MCKIKDYPIDLPFKTDFYSGFCDFCLAETLLELNKNGIETRFSCCGHSKPDQAYLTAVQNKEDIRYVLEVLKKNLGWYVEQVVDFKDSSLKDGKVYIGYYLKKLNSSGETIHEF